MSTIGYATNTKGQKMNRLGAVLLSAAFMLTAASSPALAEAEQAHSGLAAPIEGTWILAIHRVAQGITFTALQSFTAGGVALATGSVDRTPPPPISPIYGSWNRSAGNTFEVTIYFFLFDPAGNAVGMIKNNESFRLTDANHVEGLGEAFFCNTNAENCVNVQSPITITGRRVVAEGVL